MRSSVLKLFAVLSKTMSFFNCETLRLCAMANTDMLDLGGIVSLWLCLGVF